MPVQRGKKKSKRDRRRLRGPLFDSQDESETGTSPVASTRTRPVSRGRRPIPLWANSAIGLIMLAFGLFFYFKVQQGTNTVSRLLLLLAYCAVAGFYLFRAARQYRTRRGT